MRVQYTSCYNSKVKITWQYKCITLTTLFFIRAYIQPMATGYTTSVTNSFTPLHSLHRKSRSYSTVYTINTSKPANLLHRRKASKVYTAIVRDLHLTHTHLGSRPFHQLPRPSPLQNLSLPCMPRTYKCPCFTLSRGVNLQNLWCQRHGARDSLGATPNCQIFC